MVGVPRSGTTLLRLMLDAHPEMAVPPETHFVPGLLRECKDTEVDRDRAVELLTETRRWSTFGLEPDDVRARLPGGRRLKGREVVRAFYEAYAARAGKPRWGDKTPRYLSEMRRIERALPEAHFVHIIRDARDVALSMTAAELTLPDSAAAAARRWTNKMRRAMREGERAAHYLEVRYEQLVLDTEPTLRRVCEFIDLPWNPVMLDYHRNAADRMQVLAHERPRPGKDPIPAWYGPHMHALTSRPPVADRVERWRTEMSPEDRAACEAIAGELLAELGYEVEGRSPAPARRRAGVDTTGA